MKKIFLFLFLFCIFLPLTGMAVGLLADKNDPSPNASTLITYEEVQSSRPADNTPCATQAFADALAETANTVEETDDELTIKQWITVTFAKKDVLTRVLACPEVQNTKEDETIKFLPIIYNFPSGREIVVNYETQPLVLKQRLQIANKRALPLADPNPRVGVGEDVWTNTDPAWYGIIVTEHGTLDNFVGPNKNNTISLAYIHDNIDKLYPHGFHCTSKSAWALDDDSLNEAVTKTVGVEETTGEKDTNDYYVAGDISLEWVMYAEIALDVVISVVTFGSGAVVSGITKSARASRVLKNSAKTMKTLRQIDNVQDVNKVRKAMKVREWASTTRQITQITEQINKLDKVKDATKIADLKKDLDKLNDTIKTLETIDEVKQYKKAAETYQDLMKYRNSLRLMRNAKRGNIAVRAARFTKSAFTGNRKIHRAMKQLGRSSSIAGRVRDWLFMSTMRNMGILAKAYATTGFWYTAAKTLGDMYDKTETSTGDYTNNIEFSPLLLLSADDIKGQENEINYGMWLLWAGDSVSAADDDAAFLQAMDFASKVHEDLVEHQGGTNDPCNVDIYVVRPIIRNPGTDQAALYYLVMNDEPWTTAQ